MTTISASAVKDLREKTGVGMMEAKKALEEAGGDFEKAVDILRKKGLSAAAKKAARVASEGMIASFLDSGGKVGVLIEVNSETDFVAKNADFQSFSKGLAETHRIQESGRHCGTFNSHATGRERRSQAQRARTKNRRKHRNPPIRALRDFRPNCNLPSWQPYRCYG